jgi:hypothetical protein
MFGMPEERELSFPEAACLLVRALEARGATFAIDAHGALQVNVDRYASTDPLDKYLLGVHYLGDHIKGVLARRQRATTRTPDQIMPRQAAILLMAHLEARGAVFTINADNQLWCDLNGLGPELGLERAEMISAAVLGLATEIKTILAARSTLH